MNQRFSFIKSLIVFVVFILLEAVAFIIIKNNSIVQRYGIMEGFRDIQSFFYFRETNISDYFSLRKTNFDLQEENISLKNENERLRAQIVDVEDSISSFRSTPQYQYISAKIVRNSVDKQHNYIILNKGSEDGVSEDMGVITSDGVVGYVLTVGKHYSRVASLLDIDQSLSVFIKSNHTFGTIKWDGTDIRKTILHDIPLHTDIVPGDTIITSGYSSTYPPNIPIGVIESSQILDGINYDVTITLFEDFKSLRYVYVVKNRDKDEIRSLYDQKEDER